jgi:hypothetical protein
MIALAPNRLANDAHASNAMRSGKSKGETTYTQSPRLRPVIPAAPVPTEDEWNTG